MSVEDVMKVNKLAQELLNQKIVLTRDEAVRKAQEMLNKDLAESHASLGESRQSGIDKSPENLRNMLDRMKERYDKQFEAYKQVLMAFEKELMALKSQIASGARRVESQPRDPAKPEIKTADGTPMPDAGKEYGSAAKSDANKGGHHRSGNYKPSDVSVDKMFYFGNR
jgi:dsDNA-specific endonuclease/ATPase MutS2